MHSLRKCLLFHFLINAMQRRNCSVMLLCLCVAASASALQSDGSDTNTINTFYVVSPRTLDTINTELTVNYTTNNEALNFTIRVLKPEPYAYRSQENDNLFENEHIRIYVSPNTDAQNLFVFGINHQNAYFDGIYNDQAGLTSDWNGQWTYSVDQHDDYWSVSGSIPWKNFSFSSNDTLQNIRLGFAKHGNNQQRILSSVSAYIGHTGFTQPIPAIEIEIERQSSFEVFPHYSLNHSLLNNNKNNTHNIGGELFWQPNQNLSLDLSVNPDFGQVESNDLIVNFSAIEAFFSEQRPFFTRNQSLFDISGPENLLLVHTPRIGGSSVFEDVEAREITGAARLNYASGKLSHSLLFTSENDKNNILGRNFLAVRSKYVNPDSSWGLSANMVDTPSIERRATVLGIDYFSAINDTFEINAGLLGSIIKANNNSADLGAWIQTSLEIEDTHLHDFTLFVYGDELELNDLGFVQRVDRKQFEYEYAYLLPTTSISFIEQMSFGAELEIKTNFENEKLPRIIGFKTEFVSTSDASFEFGFEIISAGKDDLLTRNFNSTKLDSSWVFETVYASPELTFGQLEFEFEYGIENWSGQFHDAVITLETEIVSGVFSEISVSQYQSKSWLNWEGENEVSEFNFNETSFDVKINYRFSEQQEIRLRLELLAGEAIGKSANLIDTNGDRQMLEQADDFSFSEAAFQIRYKYTLSKLSAIFLSYTFGGEFEDESIQISRRGLYSRAINNKNTHGLFFKARLQF